MLTDEQRQSLSDLNVMSGVPNLVFREDGAEVEAFPESFGATLTNSILRRIPSALAASKHPDGALCISWDILYTSAAIRLAPGLYLTTAPTSLSAHSETSLFDAMVMWVRAGKYMDFYHCISGIPPLGGYQLAKLISLAKQLCSGAPADGISISTLNSPQPAQDAPISYFAQTQAVNQRHATHYEQSITTAIERGDVTMLTQAYNRPLNGYIGRMSMNDVRQAKYVFICYMFMASRAAAKGGAPTELCMQMSDRYSQAMDGMTLTKEVSDLTWTALTDFCKTVNQSNGLTRYNPVTRLCCEYIKQHLYDPITIEDLVGYCHLNRRSIAQYFKQDIGIGIPEYINRQRLEEAKYLLVGTKLSLSQISQLLQYSCQSYFGKLFLKYYGFTPMQYRNKNV